MERVFIREAKTNDFQYIIDILNIAILRRSVTTILIPETVESRKLWFDDHLNKRHPIYVAELEGRVVGWLAVGAYRPGREGYRKAGELSYYIDPEHTRKGIANALLNFAVAESQKRGLTTLVAVVLGGNHSSQKLLTKNKFERWGHFPGIAEIDGQIIDSHVFGIKL